MRSKFLQEIIDETPQDVERKVSRWADQIRRSARYEARRASFYRRLVNIEVGFGNYKRDQNRPEEWPFCTQTKDYELERNYTQQEID